MKSQKKTVGLLAAVFLIFSAFSLMGSQPTGNDELTNAYNRLMNMAAEKGYIRVIIKMDVPDIREFTERSSIYQTGIQDSSYSHEAFNADLALEEAISKTRDRVLHQLNGKPYRISGILKTVPAVGLTVTPETLEKLKSIPEVIGIEEDKLFRVSRDNYRENEGVIKDIPNLTTSIGIVGADQAWGFGYDGSGWYVAVIDDGILPTHEMFNQKQLVEACFATGEDFWNTNVGDCPNGQVEMIGPGSAAHYAPQYHHGSHTTGIALGNNGNDRFGVARGADIISVMVGSYFPDENDVLIWNYDALKALEHVYTLRTQYQIASVNMSLGGGRYTSYCSSAIRAEIVTNLRNAGIATCISSGNDGYCDAVGDPACVPDAVTVNATTKQDTEYSFGNWHDGMVDILAPGVSISSAVGTADNGYGGKTGTSMAAPHVAGAFAIMKQYDPTMTVDEILDILQQTGRMIDSKCSNAAGPKPRMNIGDAIASQLFLAPPTNLAGEQETNKSLLQTEYINVLTWTQNPLNQGKNVQSYRVYVVGANNQMTRIAEVDANTFVYWHRGVERRENMTYAFSAVDNQGNESAAGTFTLSFGISQ